MGEQGGVHLAEVDVESSKFFSHIEKGQVGIGRRAFLRDFVICRPRSRSRTAPDGKRCRGPPFGRADVGEIVNVDARSGVLEKEPPSSGG